MSVLNTYMRGCPHMHVYACVCLHMYMHICVRGLPVSSLYMCIHTYGSKRGNKVPQRQACMIGAGSATGCKRSPIVVTNTSKPLTQP